MKSRGRTIYNPEDENPESKREIKLLIKAKKFWHRAIKLLNVTYDEISPE